MEEITTTDLSQFNDSSYDGAVYLLFLFCYLSSMCLLTAMTVERRVSVLFPIWYRYHSLGT
ncbi:PREDICTED: proto-oncogene Mas-like, partial [Leptosomus discolor]|uniref:proto-oncogene Mas-like n=1 Tax=Leptosomus discolor TaxID=188344 RepID=UPI0005228EF6